MIYCLKICIFVALRYVNARLSLLGKTIMGLRQGQKTALRRLIVTFDTIHFYDRNNVCLKDLTFLFIRQHKLWNDM